MDLVTTLIATTTTTAGATYVAAKVRRRRARQRRIARRIAAVDVPLPLETRHLSPGLARIAMGARTARLCLETPLYRFQDALVSDGPWRVRERLGEYDLALGEARMHLWQWLKAIGQLPPNDIALLRRLELDPRPLRSVIYKPGVFDRTPDIFDASLFPETPDLELVADELCAAMEDLRRFEVALLSHRPDPYR